MNASSRISVALIAMAYLCGLLAMLLWVGQAIGIPTLGLLNPRTFLRYGWLVPLGLGVAFLSSRTAPGERWIGSQFLWLTRSFIGLLLVAFGGVLCLFIGSWLQTEAFAEAAIAMWAVGGLWFLYRWVRGLLCLIRKRPVGLAGS